MIKLGQIGLNYGLNVQIPAFSSDSRFKLIGVCSNDIENAIAAKDYLNLDFATNKAEELFELVDAISIAVPPRQQAILLPQAIEKGLHVFFEKPLGYIPLQNNLLRSDNSLMPDFEFLEVDVWKDLKRIIDLGNLGKILHSEIVWNVETFAVSKGIKSWKTNSNLSGGVLNNFAPHCFYYIEQFMGKISTVDVKAMRHSTNAEEVVYIYLQFHSGASASICLSSNTYKGSGHFLEFTGTEGTARLTNSSNSTLADFELNIFYKNGKSLFKSSDLKSDGLTDDRISSVSALVKKFGNWIETGEIQSPNVLHAIRVQNLLNKSSKSIIDNTEVELED